MPQQRLRLLCMVFGAVVLLATSTVAGYMLAMHRLKPTAPVTAVSPELRLTSWQIKDGGAPWPGWRGAPPLTGTPTSWGLLATVPPKPGQWPTMAEFRKLYVPILERLSPGSAKTAVGCFRGHTP